MRCATRHGGDPRRPALTAGIQRSSTAKRSTVVGLEIAGATSSPQPQGTPHGAAGRRRAPRRGTIARGRSCVEIGARHAVGACERPVGAHIGRRRSSAPRSSSLAPPKAGSAVCASWSPSSRAWRTRRAGPRARALARRGRRRRGRRRRRRSTRASRRDAAAPRARQARPRGWSRRRPRPRLARAGRAVARPPSRWTPGSSPRRIERRCRAELLAGVSCSVGHGLPFGRLGLGARAASVGAAPVRLGRRRPEPAAR